MQRALVAGLASVQDSELPLLCSNFWSRHILRGGPAGGVWVLQTAPSHAELSLSGLWTIGLPLC